MKKIVLVAILAVTLTGCTKPQEQQAQTNNAPTKEVIIEKHGKVKPDFVEWDTFLDSESGISFDYPAHAEFEIEPHETRTIYILSYDDNSIHIEIKASSDLDLDPPKNVPGFLEYGSVIDTHIITLSGIPGENNTNMQVMDWMFESMKKE